MKPALTWMGAVGVLLVAGPADAAIMACGDNVVSDRAWQVEVRQKCGEPAATDTRTELVTVADGVFREVRIDIWFYDFGPNDLTKEVWFRDGRLVNVRSGGYGTKRDARAGD